MALRNPIRDQPPKLPVVRPFLIINDDDLGTLANLVDGWWHILVATTEHPAGSEVAVPAYRAGMKAIHQPIPVDGDAA